MWFVRKLLAFLGIAVFGAVVALFSLYLAIVNRMPELQEWHRPVLSDDFRARDANESFAAYLERERALFDELGEFVRDRTEREGLVYEQGMVPFDRYLAPSPSNPANHDFDWNRTFVFEPDEPRGGVLLLHGLSDSPYSVRAMGELFRDAGYAVIGLRLPGHGTIPGALTEARWRDWREATRIAAHEVHRMSGEGRPFMIVGYSNGGALAVDYALGVIEGSGDPEATDLVLFAPAIGVSPVAALASFQRWLAYAIAFEKLAWTDIQPEYDPYKFNSFPVFAGEQIHGLTSSINARIGKLVLTDGLKAFPRVITFQSIVDATLPPLFVVQLLLGKLPQNGSELVLFDINRMSAAQEFLGSVKDEPWRAIARSEELPFDFTFITNESETTLGVMERKRLVGAPPGRESWSKTPLDLQWPRGIFSLSHVAMPFREDDPIYGVGGDPDDPRDLRLGGVEARGERGVLAVPLDLLMRLRFNPFYPYVAQRVEGWLDEADERSALALDH
jgi:pimeloyl-ACP methyl ester carboxylesterase